MVRLIGTVDLTSGYFQMPVKKEAIPKRLLSANKATSIIQLRHFREPCFALHEMQWLMGLINIDAIIVFGKDI